MEEEKITKAAGIIGLATLLSRISGLIRDVVVAKFFGTSLYADAFFVAFRIPNLLRRLLAEGSLTVSFIPIFTEYLNHRTKKEALDLVHIAFTLFFLVLGLASLLGILLSPLIVRIMAPGFAALPTKLKLTIFLNRIMFPYLFFIGMVALSMGILNSLRHFIAPALSPVLLNISMILSVLLLSFYFNSPILSLALGVILGGIIQLLFQVPFLKSKGITFRINFNFSHPAIRRIGKLMLPAAFGVAVYQLNILVSTIIASFLPEGSVSYLYYADRLMEFPLGIFAVAIGTAVLPSMSSQAAQKDLEGLKETLSFALRTVFFITIPAMVGLIVLRIPIINLLFQRGNFDYQATLLTSQALLYYALGLGAIAGIRVVAPAFYSLQDTKTPVKIAILAFVFDILLSLLLAFPLNLKHGGLALATSLSSGLNLILLLLILKRRLGELGAKKIVASFCKVSLSSLFMGIVIYLTGPGEVSAGGTLWNRFFPLASTIGLGILVFILSSYLLKSPELISLSEIIRKKRGDKR